MLESVLDVNIAGHQFQLLPDRGVLWAQQSCLLLADVHLGKADTFRQFGIAVPHAVQLDDIARIHALLKRTRPRRLLVLGDFLHGAVWSTSTQQAWHGLVGAHPAVAFDLLIGNHDRMLHAADWALHSVQTHMQLGSVMMTHEPLQADGFTAQITLNIHGHIHPAFQLGGWYEKLPALVYQPPYLMLPAFSAFTAGVVQPTKGSQVWVFIPQEQTVARVV